MLISFIIIEFIHYNINYADDKQLSDLTTAPLYHSKTDSLRSTKALRRNLHCFTHWLPRHKYPQLRVRSRINRKLRYRALSSAYADGLRVKTAIKTNACHKAGACFYLFYYTREPVLRTLCLLLRSKRSLVNNA